MKPNLTEVCLATALTCDGAMGTELIARGMRLGECGMRWNEDRPDDVVAVHRAYRDAGCRLITSNSFGGTHMMLARHGLGSKVAEWNRLSARLAAEVAGPDAWVIGDVGPFGDFLAPIGDVTVEELETIFREQVAALVEGGADAILIETMTDQAELTAGVRAAKSVTTLPVIATYAFQKSAGAYRTMLGRPVATAIKAAYAAGADIVGANCGTDLSVDDYREIGGQIVVVADGRPTIVQPNAGAPHDINGVIHYYATPGDLAALARDLRDAGITIVGGCCGTTPAHLAAMAAI